MRTTCRPALRARQYEAKTVDWPPHRWPWLPCQTSDAYLAWLIARYAIRLGIGVRHQAQRAQQGPSTAIHMWVLSQVGHVHRPLSTGLSCGRQTTWLWAFRGLSVLVDAAPPLPIPLSSSASRRILRAFSSSRSKRMLSSSAAAKRRANSASSISSGDALPRGAAAECCAAMLDVNPLCTSAESEAPWSSQWLGGCCSSSSSSWLSSASPLPPFMAT